MCTVSLDCRGANEAGLGVKAGCVMTAHRFPFCQSLAVRFSFEDAERLPELLKAIPESEILRKQRNIRKVWRRYARRSGQELDGSLLTSGRMCAFLLLAPSSLQWAVSPDTSYKSP